MIESLVHVLLLSLCVGTSCYQVLALTPDNNNDNGEGRFPIQMPQIHPYRVSANDISTICVRGALPPLISSSYRHPYVLFRRNLLQLQLLPASFDVL